MVALPISEIVIVDAAKHSEYLNHSLQLIYSCRRYCSETKSLTTVLHKIRWSRSLLSRAALSLSEFAQLSVQLIEALIN